MTTTTIRNKIIIGLITGLTLGASVQGQEPEGEVTELDIFEVRAIAEGQRRALLEQRNAANLTNVVAADSIGRFPDANIAEALQRLPGMGIERDQGEGRYINLRGSPKEFTSVTINGVNVPASDPTTRAVDLDVFASDFVTQIEVTKALRPDQDADAIAGTVNVRTPSALSIGNRRVLGSLATSYNSMGSNHDTRGSFLYSDVFGKQKNIGLVLGVNYSRTRREVDNVEHEAWDRITIGADQREVWTFEETNFKDYETTRTRFGVNGALEFRASENSFFYVRGFASKFEDDEFRYRLRITWADGTLRPATAQNGFGEVERPWVSYQFRHRIKTDEVRSITAGGDHTFDSLRWDYSITYSEAEQYYPRRDEMLFRIRVPLISYDFRANPNLPEISLFQTNEHLNTDGFQFREYARRTTDTEESEWNAATNLQLFSEMFGQPANHKFGLKLRAREKSSDFERYRDRRAAANPGVPLTAFLRDADAINFDYFLGRKHEPSLVQAYFDSVRPNAPVRNVTDGILADYVAEEDIYAGFAMTQFRYGQLDFLAGARVEHTRTYAESYTFDASTGAIGVVGFKNDYTHIFPGIHLRTDLVDDLVLRASITRGISRAPFADLAPFRNEDPDERTVSLGNPDLKPTLSTNYDVSLDYFIGTSGLISVAGFYKDLKNYIYTSRFNQDLLVDGSLQTYRVTQPVNSPNGKIYGIEFNIQQSFDVLWERLSGLGFFANYTIAQSSTDLSDGSGSLRLPGHSKYTYNIGLFYEINRLSLQLSYNHRSDYIQSVDAIRGRDFDVWWAGRSQVDLTASYQLTRNVQVFAEGTNITNTRGKRYVGSPERVLEYEEFGWWVTFGARFNF